MCERARERERARGGGLWVSLECKYTGRQFSAVFCAHIQLAHVGMLSKHPLRQYRCLVSIKSIRTRLNSVIFNEEICMIVDLAK